MAEPTEAEKSAARLFNTHDGQTFLAELARLTIANTGNLATGADADLRAHAGKCALYQHILSMIKRGQGQ
ncbi:hypothetical protein [Magnetospirillum sulfuroxidans]|uniref:Bbp19-like phage domain-containing protein n=1 Tax=Magnetospirillum sulfuroxidans TaxID=611300 RepID=A0ABS5I8S2_9PROT|nr:hypothetical protein [Magnetospirillum sulfuroxidans]MBR9970815.1 hypothetical protein [Magnetospirillum sulfuroxidans]